MYFWSASFTIALTEESSLFLYMKKKFLLSLSLSTIHTCTDISIWPVTFLNLSRICKYLLRLISGQGTYYLMIWLFRSLSAFRFQGGSFWDCECWKVSRIWGCPRCWSSWCNWCHRWLWSLNGSSVRKLDLIHSDYFFLILSGFTIWRYRPRLV